MDRSATVNATAILDWLKANKSQATAWVAAVAGWVTALSGPGAGEWAARNAEWVVPSVLLLVSGVANVVQAVRTGQPVPDLPPAPKPPGEPPLPVWQGGVYADTGGFTVTSGNLDTPPHDTGLPSAYTTEMGTVTVTSKE